MVHTLTIIGALVGSLTFTSLSGWRSYVKGERRKALVPAATVEREQEQNSAGLEDFLDEVGEGL